MRSHRTGAARRDAAAVERPHADTVTAALRSTGTPLDAATRALLESRFGHDFTQVRVHTDPSAAASARRFGASAYTVGSHIVVGPGGSRPAAASTPGTSSTHLLAHELAHVVQQSTTRARDGDAPTFVHPRGRAESEAADAADRVMAGELLPRPLTATAPGVARQLLAGAPDTTAAPASRAGEQGRFGDIHESLFVRTPKAGSGAAQPWTPEAAALVTRQLRSTMQQRIDENPMSVLGTVSARTTQADAEADALRADARIRGRYAVTASPLTPERARQVVTVVSVGRELPAEFLRQWLANQLIQHTQVSRFDVTEDDPRFERLLDDLLADSQEPSFDAALNRLAQDLREKGWTEAQIMTTLQQQRDTLAGATWGWVYRRLARRVQAFHGGGQDVALSEGITPAARQVTLLHEMIHFHADDRYRSWVDATTSPRFYNEGFTEFLARQVMTSTELSRRTSYADRVDAIEAQVAPFVSVDDIARAYFQGEVWRLEGRTAIARQQLERQVGLAAGAERSEEVTASRQSSGFVETVVPGTHYRFSNLGVNRWEPKAEHVAELRRIVAEVLHARHDVRLHFVGHASAPGSARTNLVLSRRRAAAFSALAGELGVPEQQLVDARTPAHEGERQPIASDEDVHGRAFNRRVELFLIPVDGASER